MVWIARYYSWLMNPMALAVGIALQRWRVGGVRQRNEPRWYSHGHIATVQFQKESKIKNSVMVDYHS